MYGAVGSNRKGFWLFMLLSYLLTWLYLVPQALAMRSGLAALPRWLELIAAYGPALAGLAAAGYLGGRAEIKAIFRRLAIWRVPFRWYLVALLLQPALCLLACSVALLAGVSWPGWSSSAASAGPAGSVVLIVGPVFILQALSLLGEELGWRGFALPFLLRRYHWLTASLLLGLIWSGWHIPLFLTPGTMQAELPAFWYFFDLMATTFVLTWLYQKTNGSVLLATVFHASINTTAILLPISPTVVGSVIPYALAGMLKWLLVAGVVLRAKKEVDNKEGITC